MWTQVLLVALLISGVVGWGTYGHQAIGQCAQSFLTTTASSAEYFFSCHKYRSTTGGAWSAPMHYTNVAKGTTTYNYARDCPGLCVVSAIYNYTTRMTKGTNGPASEPTNLEWLVHFIADIHQPLHVGYSSDSGGSTYTVYWYGTKTNLHAVWDTSILTKYLILTTWQQYATQLQTTLKNTTLYNDYAKATDPVTWAQESLNYVVSNVYSFNGDQLGDAYQNANWPVVNRRALQACVRLASTFNNVFK